VQASADEDEDQTMKILGQLWHSLICGCHKEKHRRLWSGWARLLFPLLMALSVGWFLVRVIPKPIRATYPCQQAAFPLLSCFVIWLLGLKTALVTWLAGNFGFGLMFCLLAIPAVVVMVLGIVSGKVALMIGCIGLGVIHLIVLGLVQSALQSIFQAAVFLYARDGQVPAGFEAEVLGNAMVSK
jgi:hypothetical protein